MRHILRICSAALLVTLSACSVQDARNALARLTADKEQSSESVKPAEPAHPKKAVKRASRAIVAEPKPEPTQQELVEYLRGKLLALSPSDGINDNLEVRFDPSTSTLTILQPGSRCDHFLNALDASNLSWDVFDPSDSHNSREDLLRLTVTSVSGKAARACFGKDGQPEEGTSTNRIRLLFSLSKSQQVPGFQARIAKVVKKLIVLAGGDPEKDIFQDSRGHRNSANK
jgi:hypothetical protein